MNLSKNSILQMIKNLERIKSNLKSVEGTHYYLLNDVFTEDFVSKHTKFKNISDFLSASGFDFSSQESFRNIDQGSLDKYISENSDFETWEDMKSSAGKILISSKINC